MLHYSYFNWLSFNLWLIGKRWTERWLYYESLRSVAQGCKFKSQWMEPAHKADHWLRLPQVHHQLKSWPVHWGNNLSLHNCPYISEMLVDVYFSINKVKSLEIAQRFTIKKQTKLNGILDINWWRFKQFSNYCEVQELYHRQIESFKYYGTFFFQVVQLL